MTEEELAEIVRGHQAMKPPWTPEICRRCQHYWPCPTARMVEALRACTCRQEEP